jgi:hypothetical protein
VAKIRDLPLGNYPAGSVDFGPRATPNGLNGFDVRIGRCTTLTPDLWVSESTIIMIDMQFSYDGGITYTPIGANSWSSNGGIKVTRGIELAEDIVTWGFSPDEPTHLKGRISANEPVRTYVDVTITE